MKNNLLILSTALLANELTASANSDFLFEDASDEPSHADFEIKRALRKIRLMEDIVARETVDELKATAFLKYLEVLAGAEEQAEAGSRGAEGLVSDWSPYLRPVIDQGDCSNCYIESMVEQLEGQINKYLDSAVKSQLAATDGRVHLSSDMLTQCPSQNFMSSLEALEGDLQPGGYIDYEKRYVPWGQQGYIPDEEFLFGCDGGSWEGVYKVLLGKNGGGNGSPMFNGVATEQAYTGGYTIAQQHQACRSKGSFRVLNVYRTWPYTPSQIQEALKAAPIPTAMYIPECNDGSTLAGYRGGGSGRPRCRRGRCSGRFKKFRRCAHSTFLEKYEDHDIIMANGAVTCSALIDKYGEGVDTQGLEQGKGRLPNYSHDTVIIGYGKTGRVGWMYVKQSWGSSFGQNGYMKVEAIENYQNSAFCMQKRTLPAGPLEFKHPKTGEWEYMENPWCGKESNANKSVDVTSCNCYYNKDDRYKKYCRYKFGSSEMNI